jgi:hypothetical protein
VEILGFRDEKSSVAKKILSHISAKIPFLLTDDADAAHFLGRAAAQKGIKLRMCASAIVELINARKISPMTAKGKLEELIKKRSWEGGILEVLARRYLEEGKW